MNFKIVLASSLFASSFCLCDDHLEQRLSQLEADIDEMHMQTVLGTCGVRLTNGYPELCENNGWSVAASLLAWQPFEQKTSFALIDEANSFSGPVHSGQTKRIAFDWGVGYRASIGYNFYYNSLACPEWDTQFTYTYFHTAESNDATVNNGFPVNSGVISLLFPPFLAGTVEYDLAQLKWRIKFSTFDLDLARSFFFTQNFTFRPFLGLKGALIFQRYHVLYLNSLQSLDDEIHSHNDFRGIGIKTGADAHFYFNSNWSLFNSFSSALLFGKFHVKTLLTSQDPTTPGLVLDVFDISNAQNRIVPQVQNILGLSWETNIMSGSGHLALRLGYEMQYWWSQNQFNHFLAAVDYLKSRNNDDFSTQGVTLDLKIDF